MKRLFALLVSGMMYAAILCGAVAVISLVISKAPIAWEYISEHGIGEVALMGVFVLIMALLFIALGWCGVELSRLTYDGITKGWDK